MKDSLGWSESESIWQGMWGESDENSAIEKRAGGQRLGKPAIHES